MGVRKKENQVKKSFFLLALIVLVGSFAFAQDFSAIKGTVHDTEGNGLPGVKVSLTGSKVAPMAIITSAEGNFRFMRLPSGNDYTLSFELQGFKTVIREKQVISFGNDVEYDIVMEVAAIEESVTVVGQTPVIDTKKTQVGVNITQQMIMSLPTSRNPWVLMQLAPGMMIDREDVGGAEAGQQSGYHGNGSVAGDSTWNVDGANITDNAALGATPAYLDMSGYEEMQVSYGNSNITAQTGGVQLNFVSRRGGNTYSGNFFLDAEEEAWQATNIPADLVARGYKGAGVDRVYLYGANFGGPLVKDKIWFFGSYGIQDINARSLAGTTDKTWLKSGYARLDFQLTPTTRANLYYQYNSKLKWGRTTWGSTLQSADTLLNQQGPSPIYKGEIDQVIGNLFLSAKVIYSHNTFYLDPVNGDRTSDMSGPYEWEVAYPEFYVSGNINASGTERPMLNTNFNGNYFAEGLLGGDHEIKFGVDYVHGTMHSYSLYESNLMIYTAQPSDLAPDVPWVEAWVNSDWESRQGFDRYSGFVQDTATYGKLTISAGLRYDVESAYVNPESQPASPWLPQYLGALSIGKFTPPVKGKTFSPRLSLIYDINGDGKDVVKFNIAQYGTQTGYSFADFTNPAPWREIDLRWVDANGDARVTSDELWGTDWSTGLPTVDPSNPEGWSWYGGFDPSNPAAATSPNEWDPDFKTALLDEASISYEKEVMDDFAVRVEGFYKKRHRLVWDKYILADGTVAGADDYYLQGYDSVTGTPYYGLTQSYTGYYRTNANNAYTRYLAASIVLKKRLSHNWMLDGSFTFMDWKYKYNGDYMDDPTNASYFDGGVNANAASGSGMTDVYVNSRWMAKFSGLYQFPYGINASFSFLARDGYVVEPYHSSYRSNIGWTNMYASSLTTVGKLGDTRLPSFTEINLRLEKVFSLTETMSVTVAADAFNLLNAHTTLSQVSSLSSSKYGLTNRILNPRIFRFGVHFNF
jgi:hypothetical protein